MIRIARRTFSAHTMITSSVVGSTNAIGQIQLNRPKKLNALCKQLGTEVVESLEAFDRDPTIRAVILKGDSRAFAAGADIAEMAGQSYVDVFTGGLFAEWQRFQKIRKPVIASVGGFALGGGCELAMMCDIIIAGENAKFGQPEIKIGTIPGMGGSQRLTLAIGKSKAMHMVLTGDMMSAKELEQSGLVAKVVPNEELDNEVLAMAEKIAANSLPAIMLAKEAVNATYENTLQEGLRLERKLFESTFATLDQKEGMGAFVEKRAPSWQHK